MKKAILFLLVCALVVSMAACSQTEPTDPSAIPTTQPSTEPTAEPTEEPATEPTTEPTIPEEPEAAFDNYQCIHTEQRDLDWEEDIVYMARLYLGEYILDGHPSLAARRVSIHDVNNQVYQRYFYDAELRDNFIASVRSLIDRIPELTDLQICYELKRIVAHIGDGHSQVYAETGDEYFPIVVERMENNGELGYYVTRIPSSARKVIYAKLVSINGVPVDEVVQRLGEFVTTESEAWARDTVYSVFGQMLIADKDALQAANIVGQDADTAVFCFETGNGTTETVELEALDIVSGEYWEVGYIDRISTSMGFLTNAYIYEASYFYQYLDEYDTMFLRLYDFSSDTDYRLEQLLEDMDQELKQIGHIRKIVIDVRDNPGGNLDFEDDVIDFLREMDVDDIYILMDDGSYSAATLFPNRASKVLDNVTLVGSPTAQSPNFFASATWLQMRKHAVQFSISTSYSETDPNFVGDSLVPDIYIYQNLSDYKMGVDTVLQAVLDME